MIVDLQKLVIGMSRLFLLLCHAQRKPNPQDADAAYSCALEAWEKPPWLK